MTVAKRSFINMTWKFEVLSGCPAAGIVKTIKIPTMPKTIDA